MSSMILLITTDFHASQKALIGLDKLCGQKPYDAVIMAGDLINPDPKEMPYVREFISLIKDKHRLPLFGLHGNNEPLEAMRYYRESDINIHLKTRQFQGYNICGIGGFGGLDEPVFADLSVQNLIINEKTIFVTHIPPRANAEPEHGPLVHLYGHLHVHAFTKQVKTTLRIQCPAAILGRVTELELPKLHVDFITL